MQLAEYTGDMLAEVNAQIPSGRHVAPAEIASALFCLASAEADFLADLVDEP